MIGRKVKKTLLAGILATLILPTLLLPSQAFADAPYAGYTWNKIDEDVRSINGYLYDSSIDPTGTDVGIFKNQIGRAHV